jgi:hypothetical protein
MIMIFMQALQKPQDITHKTTVDGGDFLSYRTLLVMQQSLTSMISRLDFILFYHADKKEAKMCLKSSRRCDVNNFHLSGSVRLSRGDRLDD